jgi:hypothetical protein
VFRIIHNLRNSLASKGGSMFRLSILILAVGTVLLITIATWAFFNIRYQKEKMMRNMVAGTDRLTTTIRLGTHYAMMLNARDEINQIINNIGRQPEIENIRIYNKSGEIKYSNKPEEVEQVSDIEPKPAISVTGTTLPKRPSPWRREQGFSLPIPDTGCWASSAPSPTNRAAAPATATFTPREKNSGSPGCCHFIEGYRS